MGSAAPLLIAGLIVFGLIFLYLKKKKEPLAPPGPEPQIQKTLDLISKIDSSSETYEIKQRRQIVESRVAKRVLEISYMPVDNVQLMHDLDTIATDTMKKDKSCLEQTIFETINTLIFGQPTHEEVEILEMVAAKAYLKSKGRALIVGFDYNDVCGSQNPPQLVVPVGYREQVRTQL